MARLIGISEAAKLLGVGVRTLYRWEENGKLLPDKITPGGQRRYDPARLRPDLHHVGAARLERKTIAYARVSTHEQKDDLSRQERLLESFCAAQGWTFELVADLGSGMNYRKKGLRRLLDLILENQVGRLVLTHKDGLLRFGAELVFALCEAREVEVVIINRGDDRSFEEDLASDVLEIVTVFSARLYGARSRKNRKLIEGLRDAAEQAKAEAGGEEASHEP